MTKANQKDSNLGMLLKVLNECQELTPVQINKYTAMYNLAHETRMGRIVELGTHRGLGTIALCFGAQARNGASLYVTTVDWFQPCIGMDGEIYDKSDEDLLQRNLEIARRTLPIVPIERICTFKRAAEEWNYPIGLLVWDGNVFKPEDDVCQWEQFVIPGGKIAMYDAFSYTGDDFSFVPRIKGNAASMWEKLSDSGWYRQLTIGSANFFVVKRRGNEVKE